MKLYLYSMILMLGLALGLVSCIDDSIIEVFVPEENPPTGTGNVLSLALNVPLPEEYMNTRSYEGVNMGSINEILIDGVRIVLYNSGIAQYSLDLDIQLQPDDNNTFNVTGSDLYLWAKYGNRILIQTKAHAFEAKDYDMLILINPNDDIKAKTAVGESLTELDTSLAISDMYRLRAVTEGSNTYQKPAYFLMTNSQGLISLKPENFYDTKEKAEKNPTYIALDRAVAKVSCNYDDPSSTRSTAVAPYGRFVMLLDYNNQSAAPWGDDYDIPEDCIECPMPGCGGHFNRETKKCDKHPHIHTYDGLGLVADRVRYMVATDLSWEVDIVNKNSYWLRHLAFKAGGTVMEQQGDTDRQNFYAEDPNFSRPTDLDKNFSYLADGSQLAPGITNSTAKKLYPKFPSYQYYKYWSWNEADTDPIYIPENTMEQYEQKKDVVTRVVFRAVLKREQFTATDTDETPTNVQTIGDFFVLKGENGDIDVYKYNNYNKDKTTFFILRPEDVAVYALEYKNKGSLSDINVHPYFKKEIEAAIGDFVKENEEFNWTDLSQNTDPILSDKLSFYKNGEIFYEVPIEHFAVSEAGSYGGYGRFGVVRNNWYKLNVESIISIGQPTIPAPTSDLIESGSTRSTGAIENNTSDNSLVRNQPIIF